MTRPPASKCSSHAQPHLARGLMKKAVRRPAFAAATSRIPAWSRASFSTSSRADRGTEETPCHDRGFFLSVAGSGPGDHSPGLRSDETRDRSRKPRKDGYRSGRRPGLRSQGSLSKEARLSGVLKKIDASDRRRQNYHASRGRQS